MIKLDIKKINDQLQNYILRFFLMPHTPSQSTELFLVDQIEEEIKTIIPGNTSVPVGVILFGNIFFSSLASLSRNSDQFGSPQYMCQ